MTEVSVIDATFKLAVVLLQYCCIVVCNTVQHCCIRESFEYKHVNKRWVVRSYETRMSRSGLAVNWGNNVGTDYGDHWLSVIPTECREIAHAQ